MHETFLENEREFNEKFTKEGHLLISGYEGEEKLLSVNKLKSHNRTSLIKVMKALEKELEEAKKEEAKSVNVGPVDIPDIETQGFNQALQLAIDKINSFINKIQ